MVLSDVELPFTFPQGLRLINIQAGGGSADLDKKDGR